MANATSQYCQRLAITVCERVGDTQKTVRRIAPLVEIIGHWPIKVNATWAWVTGPPTTWDESNRRRRHKRNG